MARRRPARPLTVWTGFLALLRPSSCSQYAAYFTDVGTQLIVQDSSGNFTYSPCNSGATPAWPTGSPLILPVLVEQIYTGAALAAVGAVQDGALYADLFYETAAPSLQHARYTCDFDTGLYTLESSESPIDSLNSSGTVPTVSDFTGLAAIWLDELDEIRLFFHDAGAHLQQLAYSADGAWTYVNEVNPDSHLQGRAVGVAKPNSATKMYTVEARSDSNLEISSGPASASAWSIETTPRSLTNSDTLSTSTQNFTVNTTETVLAGLQNWPSEVGNLALAIDQDESLYVYYIGSDNALYNVSKVEDVNLGAWSTQFTYDDEDYWPLADSAASDFALASDPGSYETRIYYMSGGEMTEIRRTGEATWAKAAALPEKSTQNATLFTSSAPSPSSSTATSTASSSPNSSSGTTASSTANTSLSSTAKIGIGIGCSVAGLLVLGALLTLFIRQKIAAAAAAAARSTQRNQQRGLDAASNDEETALHPHALQATSSNKLDHNGGDLGKDAAGFLLPDKAVVVVGGGGGNYGGGYGHGHGQTNAVLRDPPGAGSTVVYVPAYELPTMPAVPRYEMATFTPTTRELHEAPPPEYLQKPHEAPSSPVVARTELEGSMSVRGRGQASAASGPLSPNMSELEGSRGGRMDPGPETIHEK